MFNERLPRSFEIDVYIVVTSEYTLKPHALAFSIFNPHGIYSGKDGYKYILSLFDEKGTFFHYARYREQFFHKEAGGTQAAHCSRTTRNNALMQGMAAGGRFTHDNEQS